MLKAGKTSGQIFCYSHQSRLLLKTSKIKGSRSIYPRRISHIIDKCIYLNVLTFSSLFFTKVQTLALSIFFQRYYFFLLFWWCFYVTLQTSMEPGQVIKWTIDTRNVVNKNATHLTGGVFNVVLLCLSFHVKAALLLALLSWQPLVFLGNSLSCLWLPWFHLFLFYTYYMYIFFLFRRF